MLVRNEQGQFLKGHNINDLTGKRFGKLLVTGMSDRRSGRKTFWVCECDCGNTKTIRSDSLTSGRTESCGCIKEKQDKINLTTNHSHKMSGTRVYHTWQGMKARCNNPKDGRYHRYGGRGITYCKEWEEFEPFYEWAMSNGYSNALTLDRIDVNGNYEPENCRWATWKEQANNKSNNINVKYKGKTLTLMELSETTNMPYDTLKVRYDRGDRGNALTRTLNTKIRGRGEENNKSKLTKEDVLNIREKLSEGCSLQDIADKYDISKSAVSSIKNKRTWKWL